MNDKDLNICFDTDYESYEHTLPGFNFDGSSLLSSLINDCNDPGRVIRKITSYKNYFNKRSEYDMNWISWIDNTFKIDKNIEKKNQAHLKRKELIEIVSSYHKSNPIMTDVIMFSQISDCLMELGISNNYQ